MVTEQERAASAPAAAAGRNDIDGPPEAGGKGDNEDVWRIVMESAEQMSGCVHNA